MFGPFEHQVLEEMRESGATRPFVLRSDVVPDIHRNDRHLVGFVDDDVQAVGERVLGEREADACHGMSTIGRE